MYKANEKGKGRVAMYEQDFIMRMIAQLSKFLAKVIFDKRAEEPLQDLEQKKQNQEEINKLYELVDNGRINEAENEIFEMASGTDKRELEVVLEFFSYLNEKSDDFLQKNNFSRREIQEDMKTILDRYELSYITNLFI